MNKWLDKELKECKEWTRNRKQKNEAMEREIEELDYKVGSLRRKNRKERR